MKNLKMATGERETRQRWQILFSIMTFVVMIGAVVGITLYFEQFSRMQSIDLLRQSARKAVVECYAIEGSYPQDIEYLEENYGLDYNHDKYFIDYEVFASNVMPNLDVFEKK